MPRSSARGAAVIRCACPKWHASWYAARTGTGRRSATGPSASRNSARSRTRADSAAARAAHSGGSGSSRSYSFIADPHPAELTTIASTPAASNVSMVRCANLAASAARPECSDSAPQHPWERGMITSQPSAASTRAVASFTRGKNTDCTHPVSIPTTARRGPRAATRSGSRPPDVPRAAGGASRSACSAAGEIRPTRPVLASSRSALVRCSARSGAIAARSRSG